MFVLTTLACLLGYQGAHSAIELQGNFHSYRQLASELTELGIPVHCESSIANRYALIHLPPKTWDKFQGIASKALDIRFEKLADGSFEIRKDPKKAALEDKLLLRASRQIDRTYRDAFQGGWDVYQRLRVQISPTGAVTKAEIQGLPSLNYEEVQATIQSLPPGHPVGNSYGAALSFSNDIRSRKLGAELWDGLGLISLLKKSRASVLFGEDIDHWIPPDNPIGRSLPTGSAVFAAGHVYISPPTCIVQSLGIDPKTFRPTASSVAVFEPGTSDITTANFGSVEAELTWDDLYKGFADFQEIKNRRISTQKWLSTEAAATKTPLHVQRPSLSDLMLDWSQTTTCPVVMEVMPSRDSQGFLATGQSSSISISPKSLLEAISQEALVPMCLRDAWTVDTVDGVTIVKDELAFLDRVLQPNPAASIFLNGRGRASKSGHVSISNLVEAAGMIDPDEDLAGSQRPIYGELNQFSWAYPYLRLLAADLQSTKNLAIPLSQFPSAAQSQFAKSIRQLATFFRPYDYTVQLDGGSWSGILVSDLSRPRDWTVYASMDNGYLQFTLQHKADDSGKLPLALCRVTLGPIDRGQ